MPTLVVNDPSFGEGLGHLLGGLAARNDPEKRAKALALQSLIDQRDMATRNTQIQNEELLRQRQAQDRAVQALGSELQPERFYGRVPQFVEQPRPSGDFMGPMPVTAPNPERATLPQRLNAARAFAENAVRRGGTPEQALRAAYGGLGYGELYAAGLPTDENKARALTGLVEGKIPSANVPMTEGARRAQVAEAEIQAVRIKEMEAQAAMAREREQQRGALEREQLQEGGRTSRWESRDIDLAPGHIGIAGPRSFLPGQTGERRYGVLNVPKGNIVVDPNTKETIARGTDVPDPNAPPTATDPFEPLSGSNAETITYRRAALIYEQKHRAGTLTPQELQGWIAADSALYDPKRETRKTDQGTQIVIVQTPRPPGTIDPRTLLPPPSNPDPKSGITSPPPAPGTGTTAGPVAVTKPEDAAAIGTPPAVDPAETKSRTVTAPDGTQTTIIDSPSGQVDLATHDRANMAAQTRLIEVQANNIKNMLRGGPGRPAYKPTTTEMLLGDRARTGEPGILGTAKDFAVGMAQNLMDPQASVYQTHARALINALTRLESGAAIGEPERRRYIDMLIPNKLDDTPEKVQGKIQLMDDIVAMRARNMSNDDIRKWVNQKADERDAAEAARAGGAGTKTPGTTLRVPSGRPLPPGAVKGDLFLNPATGEMEEVR